MLSGRQLMLIDVAFVQVRPSPWRQAIDLGNMMLVLAVRTDPQRVYRRALDYFTAEELAEAFAATRGVASPTQLRAFMKRDPRDLLGEFRALAPARPPIVLQRWSLKRVSLAAGMLLVIAVAATSGVVQTFFPAENIGASAPACGTGHSMILSAQAVPSAALLPCIAELPAGWQVGAADIASGMASLWLSSDHAGTQAVTVTLTATCDTSAARQVPSDQPGTRRFERPLSLAPQFSDLRYYTFPGGCATYNFRFKPGASPVLAIAVDSALAFQPRSCPVRARCRVPGMSREAAPGHPEQQLLAAPRLDALVTAVVIVITAGVFAAVADHAMLIRIQRLDDAWLQLMISSRSVPLTVTAKIFNLLGLVYVTLPVRLAVVGLLALRRRWWHLAAFAAAMVTSEVLIGQLKGIYDRARPPGSLVATSDASFPSGHSVTASVTVVAAVITLVPARRQRIWWSFAAVAFSILMALSRAYLGAHWLSDASAGILLGTSCTLAAALAADQFQRWSRGRRPQRPTGTQGPVSPPARDPAEGPLGA